MLVASRQQISTFPEIPSFRMSINDHPVKQVSSTKPLGAHIDQNMNWECHIQNICKKIASALGAIKRIQHLITFNLFNHILITVVLSGATAAVVSLKSFRSSKIVQPVFYCVPIMTLISMNCSAHWDGLNSNIKDLNQLP